MPQCPKCKAEIDSLIYAHKDFVQEELTLKDGAVVYEERERELSSEEGLLYSCPECEQVLFSGETSAVDFLRGE